MAYSATDHEVSVLNLTDIPVEAARRATPPLGPAPGTARSNSCRLCQVHGSELEVQPALRNTAFRGRSCCCWESRNTSKIQLGVRGAVARGTIASRYVSIFNQPSLDSIKSSTRWIVLE